MFNNQMNGFYPQPSYISPYNSNPYNSGNQLIRVTGLDGAKAYQMSANSTAALFDSNEDKMYIKSTDGAGFPTIRTFTFKEETNASFGNKEASEFVNKDELETFKEEVVNYVKQLISQQSNSTAKQIVTTDAASKQSETR